MTTPIQEQWYTPKSKRMRYLRRLWKQVAATTAAHVNERTGLSRKSIRRRLRRYRQTINPFSRKFYIKEAA